MSPLGFLLPGRSYSGINLTPGAPSIGIPDSTEWIDSNLGGFNAITFGVTPVPEPSTWAMGVVFGVGAMVTVGMRRQATKA